MTRFAFTEAFLAEGQLVRLAHETLDTHRPQKLTEKLLGKLLEEAAAHAKETAALNGTTDPAEIVSELLMISVEDPPTHCLFPDFNPEVPVPADVFAYEMKQVETRRQHFPAVWQTFQSMVRADDN